jgi:hypothetical protein
MNFCKNDYFSSVILAEKSMNVYRECQIVQPVSIALEIIRNLTFETQPAVPEIHIKGRLPRINVRFIVK